MGFAGFACDLALANRFGLGNGFAFATLTGRFGFAGNLAFAYSFGLANNLFLTGRFRLACGFALTDVVTFAGKSGLIAITNGIIVRSDICGCQIAATKLIRWRAG